MTTELLLTAKPSTKAGLAPDASARPLPLVVTHAEPIQTSRKRRGRPMPLWIKGVPLVLAVFLGWEAASRTGILDPIFFPPFSVVLRTMVRLLVGGGIWADIAISLERGLTGFVLALIVGVPLGFLMGRYRRMEGATDLLVQGLRNTSQFALLPVFIMLLGIGEASKIATTFYSSLFFLVLNTISGVKGVDPLLIKAARSMGTSDFDLLRKVILPASIPAVMAGARLGVKASLMAVIGAEMLAAKSGIGFFVQNAQLMYRIPEMYAGILILTTLGLLINYGLVWLERASTSWMGRSEASKL